MDAVQSTTSDDTTAQHQSVARLLDIGIPVSKVQRDLVRGKIGETDEPGLASSLWILDQHKHLLPARQVAETGRPIIRTPTTGHGTSTARRPNDAATGPVYGIYTTSCIQTVQHPNGLGSPGTPYFQYQAIGRPARDPTGIEALVP